MERKVDEMRVLIGLAVVVASVSGCSASTGSDTTVEVTEVPRDTDAALLENVSECRAEIESLRSEPHMDELASAVDLDAPIVFTLPLSPTVVAFAGDSDLISCHPRLSSSGRRYLDVGSNGFGAMGPLEPDELRWVGTYADGEIPGTGTTTVMGRVGNDVVDVELKMGEVSVPGTIVSGWFAVQLRLEEFPRVEVAQLIWTTTDGASGSVSAVPPDFGPL